MEEIKNNSPEWVSKLLELNDEEEEPPQSKTDEPKKDRT